MRHGTTDTERRFAWLALILFASATAILCAFHEPWHDELQAWRIALESGSLRELLVNLRYEGHPPLFHVLLRAIGFLSRTWTAAVVAHWLVACAGAWVVLRLAPFTRLQRVLIVSGYLVAYEYAVIVRPYGLGMLCALAACAAWCAPVRRGRTAMILLLLLANTSALGVLLALPMGLAMFVDVATSEGATWWRKPSNRRRAVVALGMGLATLVTVALLVIPPSDALFTGDLAVPLHERLWKIGSALATPARVFLPFVGSYPDGATAWNQWAYSPDTRASVITTDLAGLLVVCVGSLVTSRRLVALVLWLSACAALIGFFAFIYFGAVRQHGYLLVALLAASWLAYAPQGTRDVDPLGRRTAALEPWRRAALTAMLVPMVLVTAQVGLADIREPFSDAEAIATAIAASAQRDAPLVGMSYPWSQPVAALLGRPMYIPAESRWSTFVARNDVVEGRQLAARTDSVVRWLLRTHCDVLLLTGTGDTALVALRGARRVPVASRTPMSGNPLGLWRVSAPRCAGR